MPPMKEHMRVKAWSNCIDVPLSAIAELCAKNDGSSLRAYVESGALIGSSSPEARQACIYLPLHSYIYFPVIFQVPCDFHYAPADILTGDLLRRAFVRTPVSISGRG